MSCKFAELRCKEVISLCDGHRLGYVSDLAVELPEGRVAAIIVPGACRYWGFLGRKDDFVIPWHCVRKIGPDTVLVDIKPGEFRVPRPKPKGLL